MLGEENYTLDIRQTFVDELDAAVRYIERTFKNYAAVDDLIAKAYAAIDERLFAPESFEPCYREPDVPFLYRQYEQSEATNNRRTIPTPPLKRNGV